ncbi:MAG: DUF3971 domain-containing protein [Wolbachia endosymbiont of Fragariocoptes setiger]|nr:DUF3971 domain-containing protein [Wolbachia endosymbiont of Fragariocoptes setiger]
MLKKAIIFFIIISLLIFCSFIYFKITKHTEININYINFLIKKKIPFGSNINIRNTSFLWQNNVEDPCLIITDLEVLHPNFIIKIPKLFIYFKLNSLFKAQLKFSYILAGSMYVHTTPPSVKGNLKDLLASTWQLFLNVNQDARVELPNITINKNTNDKLDTYKLYINKKNSLNIHIYSQDKEDTLNDISITLKNRNDILTITGIFYNVQLDEFYDYVENFKLDKGTKFKGNISLKINKKNEIINGHIQILSLDKNINILNNVNIKLEYYDEIINIKNFHFKLKESYFSLIGKVNIHTNHALLRMNISKTSAHNLCVYTPNGMINDKFRSWYCDNIDGNISNGIIEFRGKINNIQLSNIHFIADIEDGSVNFDDDFARVEKLVGNLELKNSNFKVIVDKAQFQEFTIDGGEIVINSISKKDAVLTINGHATSKTHALYEAVKFNGIDILQKDTMNGTADYKFNFQVFNLNIDNEKQVDFLANFNIAVNIYNKNLGKHDITLKFGRKFTELKIKGSSKDKPLFIDVQEYEENYTGKFKGYLPSQIFYDNIDGYINLDAELAIDSKGAGFITGDIDLSNLILYSSYLGWKNSFEDHNKVIFSIEIKEDNELLLNNLEAIGNNLNIKFSGSMKDKNLYLSSHNFKLMDNDFSIEIRSNTKKNSVVVHGKTINLSDIFNIGRVKRQKDIQVNIQAENIIMKNAVVIKNAELNLSSIQGDYSGSHFTGRFLEDNSSILARYSEIGLEVYANNAGMLLRSLGVSKSMKKGKMSFYLSPKKNDEKYYGSASISKFYVQDAPLLTKLLSMSSLSGIVNVINKEGIRFYKYNIPFSYSNNIIDIEDSWLEGVELGIMINGKINIKGNKFQIKGQVVPAYSVNKSLRTIPLIGKLLTGGKSRGIIAIDYEANGDDKNNKVFVNFISSFTPSLLKRILGVFDHIMTKNTQRTKHKLSQVKNLS